MPEILVRRYCTVGGAEPFTEWLADLKDRKAHARILARIEVLALGITRAIDLWREYEGRRNRGSASR
jgi:putative component of toxin-antitoxin plasmid stabilization module